MFCSQCGRGLDATTQACPACGSDTGIRPTAPIQTISPSRISPAVRTTYAGFWLRFVAWVLDEAMLAGIAFFVLGRFASFARLSSIFGGFGPIEDADNWIEAFGFGATVFFFLFFILISWLYHAAMESSSWQGTIGKRALGIIVTDMNGAKIDFWRATGRFFSRLATNMIPLGIGYFVAGFTQRKQAVHDFLANTLVLHKPG